MQLPETDTADRLRAILATTASTRESLTTLHQMDADGKEYDVKLVRSEWTEVPGRPGLILYAIPHPLGRQGLWMTAFFVSPGAEYTGSKLAERRIVTVLEGAIECNGNVYGPGMSMKIDPLLSTTWHSKAGATGATLYEIVEHTPLLLPPAE